MYPEYDYYVNLNIDSSWRYTMKYFFKVVEVVDGLVVTTWY